MNIKKWGREDQITRNMKIVKMVLNGASCSVAAKHYELQSERARQITAKYCRIANPEKYAQMPNCTTVDLPWLRENKDDFLPGLEK